ncbi:hypothetical protein QN382_18935 [Pseudomonas sp. 10B1]|uniref:hypothetical protein n=1 Tax=unclassified Pseudomonas TaxID=196821 RepID=UPI002AB3F00C|nr:MULTISPECIES: hypothetical protein [unclassified Pseudomonas]MDY7561160.1 hypothetical protein [Pseudomonas sp. AB6]MEA9978542.1 hypothetical protein [Pseudomonas sp. RTS4]MEA9994267.1 hypothetical protein [Pseudomonas sp. AA4]MEB0088556.1 hypothetical protein [Pseudomonas sp. RTI1]MEB0126521.1 hypothetical protein [Pseudomonas sp. CCC1.2]
MSRRLPLIVLLIILPLWFAASYGVRFSLMEDARWVGICANEALDWQCQVRSNLGLIIHFGTLGWAALITSLIALFLPGRVGWAMAVLAMLFGIAALVLYSASLAVFAVVIAGLRLVRASRAKAL